jgi:hypothetical protein
LTIRFVEPPGIVRRETRKLWVGWARGQAEGLKRGSGTVEESAVRAARRTQKPDKRPLRPTVGLDEPCRQCGDPIYYNYRGPIEGLCGKCTDRQTSQRSRDMRRMGAVHHRESRFWIVATVILAFACGAVAGWLANATLPF